MARDRTEDMSVREQYHLPAREPVPYRMYALMAVLPLAALVLWLVFPDEPVFVALLFVTIIFSVGFGVFRAMSGRRLSQPPPDTRDPGGR